MWWKTTLANHVARLTNNALGPDAMGLFVTCYDAVGGVAVSVNVKNTTWQIEINVIEDRFYLLGIRLAEEYRGKGNGAAMYRILEHLAKTIGCTRIEQTPSGWTGGPVRDTRANYLARRGWVLDGDVAYKDLK